jgi:hypothetical protein
MSDMLLVYVLMLQTYCFAGWAFRTEEQIWRWELENPMQGNTAVWLDEV